MVCTGNEQCRTSMSRQQDLQAVVRYSFPRSQLYSASSAATMSYIVRAEFSTDLFRSLERSLNIGYRVFNQGEFQIGRKLKCRYTARAQGSSKVNYILESMVLNVLVTAWQDRLFFSVSKSCQSAYFDAVLSSLFEFRTNRNTQNPSMLWRAYIQNAALQSKTPRKGWLHTASFATLERPCHLFKRETVYEGCIFRWRSLQGNSMAASSCTPNRQQAGSNHIISRNFGEHVQEKASGRKELSACPTRREFSRLSARALERIRSSQWSSYMLICSAQTLSEEVRQRTTYVRHCRLCVRSPQIQTLDKFQVEV